MSALLAVVSGISLGAGSALLPIINAEAYAVITVGARPWLILPIVVALAVGQTCGKLLLYEAARRGSHKFHAKSLLRSPRAVRWSGRINAALTDRRTAVPVVLASASLGLPPLAIVSVAAGIAGQRRGTFAAACLIGRTVRFTAIALPAALVIGHV